jgi:hypothetical protein
MISKIYPPLKILTEKHLMNRQELIKAIDRNSIAIYYTAISCTVFWIIIGILSYRYIVEGRPTIVDHEKQMISGFYKRDVKIKMDSISNALMIQTLRHQLIEKQMRSRLKERIVFMIGNINPMSA